jgi:glycosyltransferase involved in cell wall biosynthesis
MSELRGDPQILILSGVRGDTRRYRAIHPWEQLQLLGVHCTLSHITDPQLPEKLSAATLAVFHRVTHDVYVDRLVSSFKQGGGVAVADTDDLIFDPAAFQWINSPDFQDPLRASLYRDEMLHQRTGLLSCQAALASTDFLREQIRLLEKPAWVHHNAFSLEMLRLSEAAQRQPPPSRDEVIIGYASGTPTHDRDFAMVKPALRRIMQAHPQVVLWLVGHLDPGSDWGGLAERIRRMKFVPWRQLPALLSQIDINLSPLVMDNPFSQSKSEIKYVEAGLVGVPTLASPTDAFRYAIRSGENGVLAASPQEWEQALEKLIIQPDDRHRLGEGAWVDVRRRYHPLQRAEELVATLEEVYQSLRSKPLWGERTPAPVASPEAIESSFRVSGEVEQRPTLWQMGMYSLRRRGMRVALIQVWIYFRRLLAPLFPFKRTQ